MGKIYQIFKSRKLAIGLLFLLSGISILGTIFNGDEAGSKMLSLDPSTWLSYFEAGAFTRSPVFILVMGLLLINLAICTYDRLKSNWEKLLKTSFLADDDYILNLPFNVLLKKEINKDLIDKNFIASGYKIYKNEGIFYGEKGKIHLLGTYITHICIILVIIAGAISSLFSYVGTVGIFEKQETDTYYNWMEKKYKVLPFKIRVEKLDVTYYNPTIELEIRYKQDIKKYSLQKGEGIFYQNDKIVFNDFLPDSMVENNEVYFISEFLRDPGVLFKIYKNGNDVYNYWIFKDIGYQNKIEPAYTINILSSQYVVKSSESILNIIENGEVKLRDFVRPNKSISYKGLHIYFWGFNQDEYRNYFTGLQISYDPSLWLTWVALAGILCGLYITFLVHYDRVWIKYSFGQIMIGGKTSGDKDKFVEKMQKLVNEI